jgi:hypothetical protein
VPGVPGTGDEGLEKSYFSLEFRTQQDYGGSARNEAGRQTFRGKPPSEADENPAGFASTLIDQSGS